MTDVEVEKIVWLENPANYDYVREGMAITTRRKGAIGGYWKLIGYEEMAKHGKGIQAYHRKVWWLEKHDKDCKKPHEAYQKGISRPAEAVEPKEIAIPEGVEVENAYEEKEL